MDEGDGYHEVEQLLLMRKQLEGLAIEERRILDEKGETNRAIARLTKDIEFRVKAGPPKIWTLDDGRMLVGRRVGDTNVTLEVVAPEVRHRPEAPPPVTGGLLDSAAGLERVGDRLSGTIPLGRRDVIARNGE